MVKTLDDTIAGTLRDELESVEFYVAFANRTPVRELQDLARQLAAEEECHFHALVDWLEQTGSPRFHRALQEVRLLRPDRSGQDPPRNAWRVKCDVAQEGDASQLLKLAIAKEEDSIRSFEKLEHDALDMAERQLYARIRRGEEQHRAVLEARSRALAGS